MMLTLAALLTACDAESPKDSAGRDSSVEDTGADSADPGETGDSEDSGDTGDSADSSETADVDTCDPTPYVERDTSLDTAPRIDFLAPVDTAGTEFRDTGNAGDCETFPTDAFGHPRLRCANIVVDLSEQVNELGSYQEAESEWLGDLDGDGADDLSITMRTSSTSGISTYLRYGGGVEDLGTVDPLEFADAWALETDGRQLFRGGDFNGDGLADVFTEDDDEALGVLLSDGSRVHGVQEVWPDGEVWNPRASSPEGFSGRRPFAGNIRQAWAADVTGDGLDDAIASPKYFYESDQGVAVAEGTADFESKGNLFTDSWNFVGGANCAQKNYCRVVQAVPVGDMDGDGMADLLVSSGFPAEYHYLVSPGELPKCTMAVEDVGWSALTDGQSHFPGVTFAVPGGGDFDGDGDSDLMLFADEGDDPQGLVGFFVRGGETNLRSVTDVRSLPDRVELPRFDTSGSPFKLFANYSTASDLDGDGAGEILVGGYGEGLIRARLVVLRAPVGVQGSADISIDWVSEFHTFNLPYAIPAYGRGDHDADGFDDLLVMVDDGSSVGFALFGGADMTAGGWVP